MKCTYSLESSFAGMINIKELSMTANDLKTSAVLFCAEDRLLDSEYVPHK
jgi:hypothetical protein